MWYSNTATLLVARGHPVLRSTRHGSDGPDSSAVRSGHCPLFRVVHRGQLHLRGQCPQDCYANQSSFMCSDLQKVNETEQNFIRANSSGSDHQHSIERHESIR